MLATVPARIAYDFAERWPIKILPFPFEHDPICVLASLRLCVLVSEPKPRCNIIRVCQRSKICSFTIFSSLKHLCMGSVCARNLMRVLVSLTAPIALIRGTTATQIENTACGKAVLG
jgi:hypothetical protein